MTAPFPKRYGKQMPTPIDDGSRICFQIQLPDLLEYRAALMGQLNDLGFWFSWDHTQGDYSDIPTKNKEVAELWVQLVADASFEVCMSVCEQIIDCIQNNPATQEAIRDFILGDESLNDWAQSEAAIPIVPTQELSTNFGDVEECNPDYLFNVCTVAVDLFNATSEDLFDIVEVGTNALERAELLVSAIPVIGGLLPFDEVIELAEKIVSSLQEAYLEAYTETLEDKLRCDLFCLAKDNCDLPIDRMIAYYETELGHSLPDDIVEAAQDIADFIVVGTLSGDTIVYAMHLLVLAMVRIAQKVAGVDFTTLGIRLTAAMDDANNDWMTLCDECGSPPPELNIVPNNPSYPNVCTFISRAGVEETWEITAANNFGSGLIWVHDDDNQCFYVHSVTLLSGNWNSWQPTLCDGSIPFYDTSIDQIEEKEVILLTGYFVQPTAKIRIVISPVVP